MSEKDKNNDERKSTAQFIAQDLDENYDIYTLSRAFGASQDSEDEIDMMVGISFLVDPCKVWEHKSDSESFICDECQTLNEEN